MKLRGPVVMSIAALALAGAAQWAPATQVAATSTPIRFSIRIPRIAKLTLVDHPRSVTISAEDIARGHLLVAGARIGIVSNDRRGVILRAGLLGTAVEAVELAGLGSTVEVAAGGTSIALAPAVAGSVLLPAEYRMRLSRIATPGTYRWPVTLSIEDP